MKIQLSNGNLFIDNKQVQVIIFEDGTTLRFPVDESLTIELSNDNNTNIAVAEGKNNVVVSGKNIIHGSVMNVKGGFHLGDI